MGNSDEARTHSTALQIDQVLLDAIPVPVFIKDSRGVYLGCNAAYERFLNITRGRFIGKSVDDISPPELAAVYRAMDRQLFENPGTQVYEGPVTDQCRGKHEVVFHKSTFMDAEGRVAGLVGVIQDVTLRKEAERKRRESEERHRALFEHANDAIFVMKDGTFINCNARALDMYGCASEEIVGQTPWALSPAVQPDGRASFDAAVGYIDKALAGQPPCFEWSHCRSDGTPFDAEVGLHAVTVSGERLVYAIVRDVSERKRAERERARLFSELQEATKQIKTLQGLLPICASCKKVRDDQGYWTQIDSFLYAHSDMEFSHGICPDCAERLYPGCLQRAIGDDAERPKTGKG